MSTRQTSVIVWVLYMCLVLFIGCSDPKSSRTDGNNGGTDDTSSTLGNEDDSSQSPGNGTNSASATDPVTDTSASGYYFQAGDWAGYGWTGIGPAAGGTVTELSSDWTSGSTPVCISGTLAEDYSSLGVLGMAVSQARGSQTMNTWAPGSQYTGVEVDISKRVNTEIRMELVTANGEYCALIPAGGVTLAWSAFATECWGTSGTRYNGEPFDRIQFYAPGDSDSKVNYDYCLNALSPHTETIEQDTDTGSGNPEDANWETVETVCNNGSGNQGGFVYEYWIDSGSACMELGPGGAFSIEWGSGTENVLARKGLRPGSLNQVITYAAEYRPNGNSYLTLYGWTTNPLVEYYVVDSWGSWRPPGGQSVGTVTSDGGTYDLYRTQRVEKPSIEGERSTFYQYWSVRTEKRTSGTITFANHVSAWQNQGWQMGGLYEVSMCVEGYQSTGYGNVYQLTMTTN
jgi:hypothetical protein